MKNVALGFSSRQPVLGSFFVVGCLGAIIFPWLCLTLPGFSSLNHEYTFLFSLVFGLSTFCGSLRDSIKIRQRVHSVKSVIQREELLKCRFLIGCIWFFLSLISKAVADRYVTGCRMAIGIPFFVSTWVGVSLFCSMSGIVLGSFRRPLIVGIAGGEVIVLLTLLNDFMQISFGPRVVPLDLIFGECLAFNQRAETFPSDLHWFSRIYFIGVLLLSWNSFLGHSRKGLHHEDAETACNYTRTRIRTLALAAIVLPSSFLFSGYVGLGGSDSVVRSHLNREVTTEHFQLFYSADTLKTDQVDAVIRKAEWSFHYLTQLLTLVPQKTIRVYIYPDAETKYRLTSVRSAHASIRSIHIKESEVTGSVFLHELFHSLQIEFRPSLKILLSRGMLEGSAIAIEKGFFAVPESHALLAAANQMNYLPPISSIMSVHGFSRHRESVAYSVAGSFIGFLILEYGWEPFKALNRSMDYLKVYGANLDELEIRWLKFLEQVPFSNEERRISEGRFNPRSNPGYRSQACPKTGVRHPSRMWRADDLYRAGQYRNALILYDQLNRENESFQGHWKSIQCLEKADALDAALDRIVQLWDSSALKPSEQSSLLKMKIRVLYRLRDWSAAQSVIDARRQLNLETDTQKFLFENLIDHPSHQEAFADYLDRRDRESSRMLLRKAMDLHPASPVFPFLMIREGLQKIRFQPLLRKYIFDFLEKNPNQGDLVQTELLRVLRQAFDRAEYQDCDKICKLMLDHCRHPISRFYANFHLKRLSFEREQISANFRTE